MLICLDSLAIYKQNTRQVTSSLINVQFMYFNMLTNKDVIRIIKKNHAYSLEFIWHPNLSCIKPYKDQPRNCSLLR